MLIIVTDMFKIKRGSEVTIIGDLGEEGARCSAVMTGCYLLAAKRLNIKHRLVIQKVKRTKTAADPNVIRALREIQDEDYVTLALTRKMGSIKEIGKSFRKYMKLKRAKFVSTMNLSELPTSKFHYMVRAIDVDLKQMQIKAKHIQRALNGGKEVLLVTPKGTNLKIGIKGMRAIANDGQYHKSGGNIPTGEVYIPPRKNNVDGKIVIDGSVRTKMGTIIVKNPVTLFIEKGEIVRMEGKGREFEELQNTLKWAVRRSKHDWGVKRIGELGIGINPNAQIVGPTVINEKAYGSAHCAIGSNAWFGGSIYSIIHLDQVMRNAKVYVDGKLLKY